MIVIPLHPRINTTAAGNGAGEVAFLRLEDRLLTARQVIPALASYLAAASEISVWAILGSNQ